MRGVFSEGAVAEGRSFRTGAFLCSGAEAVRGKPEGSSRGRRALAERLSRDVEDLGVRVRAAAEVGYGSLVLEGCPSDELVAVLRRAGYSVDGLTVSW